MSLTNVVYKENFTYVETIESLSPDLEQAARQQFNEYKARGVITTGTFDAVEWGLTNQVNKQMFLKFSINEVHYKSDDMCSKLGCSYDTCLRALHTFAVLQLHYALSTVIASIRAIVNFINKQELPRQYAECSSVRDFLEFLPYYTPYTEMVIDSL